MSEISLLSQNERHLPWKVKLALWNPKMDLLALVSHLDDVVLERLFWKKAWQVAAVDLDCVDGRGSDRTLSSLTWSPDGLILVVGARDGVVFFLDSETGRSMHSFRLDMSVSVLKWMSIPGQSVEEDFMFYPDELLPLGDNEKQPTDEWRQFGADFPSETLHSLLFIGGNDGLFHVLVTGTLPLFRVDLPSLTGIDCRMKLHDFEYSETEHTISVIFTDLANETTMLTKIDVSQCRPLVNGDIWMAASKMARMLLTMRQVRTIMAELSEHWEELLHGLDCRLVQLARTRRRLGQSTVGAALLQLLLSGTADQSLKTHLTVQGVHTAGESVRSFYSRFHNLLGVRLKAVVAKLLFETSMLAESPSLSQMTANSSCPFRLMANTIAELSIKIAEMRTAISLDNRQLLTFFHWLHQVLLTLNDQSSAGAQIGEIPPIDTDLLVQFIKNAFMVESTDDNDDDGQPLFRLASETYAKSKWLVDLSLNKVGQYLRRGPLIWPLTPSMDDADFADFFHCDSSTSLVDCVEKTDLTIQSTLSLYRNAFGNNAAILLSSRHLCRKVAVSARFCPGSGMLVTTHDGQLVLFSDDHQSTVIVVDWTVHGFECLSADYYKDQLCYMVVKRNDQRILVRIVIDRPFDGDLTCDNSSILSHTDGCLVHVSGPRNVGLLVGDCGTKVRLFETETDDVANRSSLSVL